MLHIIITSAVIAALMIAYFQFAKNPEFTEYCELESDIRGVRYESILIAFIWVVWVGILLIFW